MGCLCLLKAHGSVWKGRQKDHESQRWWKSEKTMSSRLGRTVGILTNRDCGSTHMACIGSNQVGFQYWAKEGGTSSCFYPRSYLKMMPASKGKISVSNRVSLYILSTLQNSSIHGELTNTKWTHFIFVNIFVSFFGGLMVCLCILGFSLLDVFVFLFL